MTALSDATHLAKSLTRPSGQVARVLDADPELASGIAPEQLALAASSSVAPVQALARGPWEVEPPSDPGELGDLILGGLVLVRVTVGERSHAELLGEGDLVNPWIPAAPEMSDRAEVTARVVEPTEIAVLDRPFALRTARWPEIHAALMRRLILRSRRLSLQSAINSIPRTQERLELTLWQFANRFGRVASGGLRLRLPISHAQLAEIVATQRPSVTIAFARLQDSGRLIRTGQHDWLLCGPAPNELAPLALQFGIEG